MNKYTAIMAALLALVTVNAQAVESMNDPATASVMQPNGMRTLSGVVKDSQGAPLPGVSVMVPGTSYGTITDVDGRYTLSVPVSASNLEVSCIGFKTLTISLASNKSEYNAELAEDDQLLEEVVVVGYGTQKKVNMTGSVSAVNFENIETKSRPMFNATQALSGAAPGLQVMQGSGNPYSENFSILVRGNGTLNSSGPLVLVDGMEQSLGNVDANDIASISILKDAASCAIYGNRGANGVILVTTKNGSDGKVSVSYNATFSYDQPFKLIKTVSNYADYMELINESATNVGEAAPFSSITVDQWRAAEKDPNGISESGYPNYVAYPNTDWYDVIYGDKWMQKHSISVSGKEKKSGYSMSLSYIDNPGIVENTGYKRYMARVNLYSDITPWLRLGARIWGYQTDCEKSNTGSITSMDTQKMVPGVYPYYNGMYGAPEANEEDPQSHNPLWDMNLSRGYSKNNQLFTDFYGKVKFLKHFSYDIDLYYKDFRYEAQSVDTDYGKYSFSTDQWVAAPKSPDELYTSMSNNREDHYKLTQVLNYSQTIGLNDISAMVGYEEQHFVQRTSSFSKLGLQDASIGDPDSAAKPYSSGGHGTEWGARSVFGRVNYAYDGRYLFEANLRYDASSRFSPKKRWGLFPSFSAGWRISQEAFMQDIHWLDNLKLRLSWGSLGNNSIGNYEWQSTYGAAKYVVGNVLTNGIAISSIANQDLEWETTKIANVGIDYGFLGNRLSGSVDVYSKLTTGILYRPDMFMALGNASGPRQNIANVTNKGVEFEIGWRDRIGDFDYSVKGNLAYNKNRVSKYKGALRKGWKENPDGTKEYVSNLGDVSTGTNTRVLEGHEINEWYLPNVYSGTGTYYNSDGSVDINGGPRDGMIRTTDDMKWVRAMIDAGYSFYPTQTVGKAGLWYGEYIYADANGDGIYGNTYDAEFQGTSSTPKYNFGIQMTAAWKGLDFSMNWTGAAGFSIYYYRIASNSSATIKGYAIGADVAKDHYFFDPKNPDDPRTNITSRQPRLSHLSGNDQSSMSSSLHLERGDYLKLRNVTLGYTLPSVLTEKVKIQSVRFFLTGENLFAITGFSGMDPEMRTSVAYSTMRQYAAGVNITF